MELYPRRRHQPGGTIRVTRVKAKVPRYPIARLREIVVEERIFVHVGRAAAFFESMEAAIQAAIKVIMELEARSFAGTIGQQDFCDLYGVLVEGEGWYFKVYIDDTIPNGEVTVVSFHPLEHDLRTNGGVVRAKLVRET